MELHKYVRVPVVAFVSTLSTISFADFIPQKVATGSYHTCVLSTEGTIKCWGYNSHGQLGTGDTRLRGNELFTMGENLRPINLGLSPSNKAIDICAGDIHTCALSDDGGVKCWGYNGYGQLGQGHFALADYSMGPGLPFSDLGKAFKAKALTCGGEYVCALSDQGQVKCWGDNTSGALGIGDTENRGDRGGEMGDKLPALAGLTNIQTISAGSQFGCALSAEGARCWGYGGAGRLGSESGNSTGHTPETIPGKSSFIKLTTDANEKILSLVAGSDYTCALMKSLLPTTQHSFVKCWGANREGTLGSGNAIDYGREPGSMGAALPRVNLALDDVVSLAPHRTFTCALSKSGRVKCWGKNDLGQLGLGDSRSRGKVSSDMGKDLADVDLGLPAKSVSTGSSSSHSCAILINNQMKCWGRGTEGQLGYENVANLGLMPNQMGDALPFVRIK